MYVRMQMKEYLICIMGKAKKSHLFSITLYIYQKKILHCDLLKSYLTMPRAVSIQTICNCHLIQNRLDGISSLW